MARKERNNVDYFPHPVNHGKKMFYLRDKFGNNGYAVWFMLLEQLGKAESHYLNLKDDVELMYLSSEFKVSEEILIDIINTLVKFGEFDSQLWEENRVLFNTKFIENISDAYKKRNNNCIDKNSLLLLLSDKGLRKPIKSNPKPDKSTPRVPDNPQRIVKDSKEKDIKVKLLGSQFWIEMIAKNKGLTLQQTQTTLKNFLNELEMKEDLDKPEKEIKSHFINFLNKKLEMNENVVALPKRKTLKEL